MQISLSFSSIDEMLSFCKDFKTKDLSKFKELRLEVNPPKEESVQPKEESKELTTALKKEFKLDDKAQICKSIIHKMIQDKGTEKVKEESVQPKEESKELTTALKKEFKLDDKAQICKSIIHKMIQDKGTEKVKEFFLDKFNKSTVPDVLNMYKDKYDELEEILLKEV